MSEAKNKTAAEVLQDQGSGEETEESLPLFPTATTDPLQDFLAEKDEEWKFDWLNDPSVVIRDQQGIAAHFNSLGELVIKQKNEHDSVAIFVAPENVSKFIAGIRERAKRGGE